jgi:hypothetical protein
LSSWQSIEKNAVAVLDQEMAAVCESGEYLLGLIDRERGP